MRRMQVRRCNLNLPSAPFAVLPARMKRSTVLNLAAWERRRSQALQPFAPAEAGIEVVPEFDVFLVLFPAKKNLFAPHDGGKINQTALQILDENPAALKFSQNLQIGR